MKKRWEFRDQQKNRITHLLLAMAWVNNTCAIVASFSSQPELAKKHKCMQTFIKFSVKKTVCHFGFIRITVGLFCKSPVNESAHIVKMLNAFPSDPMFHAMNFGGKKLIWIKLDFLVNF